MKLKFFLRGLASGVVVTTVILSIANSGIQETSLTDEQIIQKAKELGMVEADSVSVSPTKNAVITQKPGVTVEITEIIQEEEQVEEPTAIVTLHPTETATPKATATATPKPTATVTPKPTATVTPKPTATATPKPTTPTEASESVSQNSQTVTITISSGMWSDSVAAQLKALGAVDSATEFDQFLGANGYAERIAVGTYQIPAGSSYEQIAKIITRR